MVQLLPLVLAYSALFHHFLHTSRKHFLQAEREEPDKEYNVADWDFVSSTAIVEEYMENMYQCVSAI